MQGPAPPQHSLQKIPRIFAESDLAPSLQKIQWGQWQVPFQHKAQQDLDERCNSSEGPYPEYVSDLLKASTPECNPATRREQSVPSVSNA